MRDGVARFDWDKRPAKPASRREGNVFTDYGMSALIRMHFQLPTKAIVRIEGDGQIVAKSDMTNIVSIPFLPKSPPTV